MGECRNCGFASTKELGFRGQVAPFFLKRVLHLESRLAPAEHPVKKILQRSRLLTRVFQRAFRQGVFAEIEICPACTFIQTAVPFSDEALGGLYVDYRSSSYNAERSRYEPEYALIASRVGAGDKEVQVRKLGLTEWLRDKIDLGSHFSMLDYGGADGRFLPDLPGEKYVFDISDVAPVSGVTRLQSESELHQYSYIQIAHVLEHVPNPLALTRKAASHLLPGGYIYVEVPQDLSDEVISRLAAGELNIHTSIHEHINYYNASSASKVLESADLEIVRVEPVVMDLGWTTTRNIRALARKGPH